MATTLHQVTEGTKRLLIVLGITVGAIICLLLIVQIFSNLKEFFFPTPPTPPTVAFGKLPAVTFPDNTVDPSGLSYTLTTLTGTLPNLGDQVTVYATIPPQPSLLQFQKVQDQVRKAGFTGSPIALNEAEYEWVQPPTQESIATKKFIYNIATLNFRLTSDYATNASIAALPNVPSQTDAINSATNFINTFTTLPNDIDPEFTTSIILRLENGQLVPASSVSKAQFVQVNFFQKNIDKLPIVYLNTPNSTMNVLLSGGREEADVVASSYYHKSIDTNQHATYPIKTAQQAFDDLKKGNAYVANYANSLKNIIVRNVYLAQFLGTDPQTYTWPVIVFHGDNNFVAYVNAIPETWIEK